MVRDRLVRLVENLAPTPIAWLAIVVGVSVHLAGFFLFRVEVPGLRPVEKKDAYVRLVSLSGDQADPNLRERALLADSLPLFLPSQYDYAWIPMQPSFYDDAREANLLDPYTLPVQVDSGQVLAYPGNYDGLKPEDLLSVDNFSVLHTLGEAALPELAMTTRFGQFQFRLETTQEVIHEVTLEESPESLAQIRLFWKPCSVLLLISSTGSVGKPIVRQSSGVPELDRFVVSWVEQQANRGMVPAGYYRIIFGP
jgi:hypothetical protein